MIENAIRRFFTDENIVAKRLLVAVSGGFDSTALLVALASMRDDFDLVAAHVNHHLRETDSDDDEQFVRDLSARLGVTLRVADGTLDGDAVKRAGVEAAAREIRMARLHDIRKEVDAHFIVTAHQKNDQAETIVMRLMTGGGVAALRGIHAVRDDGVIRPLLAVTRDDINAYLAERGIAARLDRSNHDPRFLRNRVRMMLAHCTASEIDQLASVAAQAREQWRVLDRAIDEAEDVDASERETIFRSMPDDAWLRQALLLRHIRRLDPHARDVSARDLERLAASGVKRQNVTKSVELLQRGGTLVLRRIEAPAEEFEVNLTPEISARVGDVAISVIPSVSRDLGERAAPGMTAQRVALPRDAAPHFIVRNRRRGDRFQPLGMQQEIKLKDFLIARKVPVEERDRIPLIIWNGEIVWVAGVEVSERFKIGPREPDEETVEYTVTIAPKSRAKVEDSEHRRGL